MNESIIEKTLNEVGFICISPKGSSMKPLFYEGRDKICISKVTKNPKRNDIVLYRRDNGVFVLHRIVKVLNSSYVLCGDVNTVLEYGITDKNILGVATAYYKNEKYIDLEKSFKYKLYKFFWCTSLKMRRVYLKIYSLFRKKKKS